LLRVKTYLDKSHIHGIGLFAGEDISAGRVVWEFSPKVDLVFEPEQWSTFEGHCSAESFEQLRKYSYKEGEKYYICLDNAQFMNHCKESPNVINDYSGRLNHAARDIASGEELLCDYTEYCDPDDYNLALIVRHGV